MPGIESYQKKETFFEKIDRETQEMLNFLKNNIGLNRDPWITKQPRLEKWAAVFDYKNMINLHLIVNCEQP